MKIKQSVIDFTSDRRGDFVFCNNCEVYMLIETCEDVCPCCKKEGCLSDVIQGPIQISDIDSEEYRVKTSAEISEIEAISAWHELNDKVDFIKQHRDLEGLKEYFKGEEIFYDIEEDMFEFRFKNLSATIIQTKDDEGVKGVIELSTYITLFNYFTDEYIEDTFIV